MFHYLQQLLGGQGLAPHGYCLLWDPALIWTHVISDAIIGLSYFSIPVVLTVYIVRRRDVHFGWVAWMFAAFILACGVTHFFSIWTLWRPDYGWEGLAKLFTAAISVLTAILLWPLLPKALALPSPAQLQRANDELRARGLERDEALHALQQETTERQKTANLLHDANAQLKALASTDGLTGVANRRAFDERLQEEWARARSPRKPLALIILDLDFFKQYNDHFGHLKGDDCLRQVAKILQSTRRDTDVVARIGGEEFAILLPETNLDEAMAAAEWVRLKVESLNLPHPKGVQGIVTASVGVSVARASGATMVQDLIQAADVALYQAKARGKNQVARAEEPGSGQQS